MASSTPLPASGSRSKKPLAKMAGWLRQALSKKPKEMPVSQETTSSDAPPRCSDDPPSPDLSSTASAESPAALPPALESTSCSSSGGGAASSSSDGGAASSSSGRWSRDYDVCVCHSEEDLAAVQELVAYLEDSPASLRCFLQLRDSAPGGPPTRPSSASCTSWTAGDPTKASAKSRRPSCAICSTSADTLPSPRDPGRWHKLEIKRESAQGLDPVA
ncbi:Toll/interleukin-1 receptor domain-containing adapter protein [Myotis brandtii]|uniref:Toll/interleukin-1 receptor domain-containing adapter protein n=1 Tax=Myotis brandtii TaxID=109478 RepID=S7N3E0_MYOBR|nr:Toll/interleukin-1 receptor domain-containing adapter protein [Myotis brandtii]